MKPPFKILLYFVGVLVLGSLLSAPLYWGVQRLGKWAEAKGWLYYEREMKEPDKPAPAVGWETQGWMAPPLFFAARTILPMVEAAGWLPKKGETKAEREAREKSEPPIARMARKYARFAEKRGWIARTVKKEEAPAEPEAKGWGAFLAADFAKVSNRAIIIAAVVLLWPLLRSLRIRSLQQIGLAPNRHRWRDFAAAWFISFLLMLTLGVILFQLGVYRWLEKPPWWELGGIFVSSLVVAFLEEWVFRGAILGSFRSCMSDYLALFLVSALFAILHFLQPPIEKVAEVTWLTGFEILPQRFARFTQPLQLLGGFLTLFVFGWVCGWGVIRTRGLALSLGFHAGMVMGKFGYTRVMNRPKDMRDLLPWIGEDLAIGVVGTGFIMLVGVTLWIYVRSVRAISPRR